MSQKNYKDNNAIRNIINILEHGMNDDGERVKNLEYWEAIHKSETSSIWFDEYEFMYEPYCWVIWKKANDSYGEKMCYKIVPRHMDMEKVRDVLNCQSWIVV